MPQPVNLSDTDASRTSDLLFFLFLFFKFLSHKCPSSRRSTTWALRWWSRATPWCRLGLIWPSWFTLWTTAAQTRSDCRDTSLSHPWPLPSLRCSWKHFYALPPSSKQMCSDSGTKPHHWRRGVVFLLFVFNRLVLLKGWGWSSFHGMTSPPLPFSRIVADWRNGEWDHLNFSLCALLDPPPPHLSGSPVLTTLFVLWCHQQQTVMNSEEGGFYIKI